VLREDAGRRTVVSHLAKRTRGLLTRHLLERDDEPRTPRALAAAVGAAFDCDLTEPVRPGGSWTLDVVVRE
jgi:uncharacterized protein